MTRVFRTAAMAATTAVLCLAASACGPDGEKSEQDGGKAAGATAKPSGTASSSAGDPAASDSAPAPTSTPTSSGEVLDKAGLAKVALTTGEVANYEVTPMQGGEESGTERSENKDCEPLVAVINGAPQPTPAATVFRTVMDKSEEGKDDQTVVTEILTSHPKDTAQQLMRGVRDAVRACAGGFRTSSEDGPSTYTEVKQLPLPPAGQESIAYQVTGSIEGDKVPLVFQLVRTGSTVVTFYVAEFITAKTPQLPAELVAAQAAKLP
ncbi:hypothetical protein JGS39_38595 [Streptomyces sp. P01-B04]|uniref:hypothetical protein n=2 Tax=Streptomyces TaxID=1883 RepID=UPI001C5FF26C|nr:hypothetical protein [Streptomyces poriferorum]MBW5254794.1 hypothetical protein [Streptomyces poriferorum]MBW5262171.1 hypothetical protein [Streptomyces poriferorum]